MSQTAHAEDLGSPEAAKVIRYFVIGGALLLLAAPSAFFVVSWLLGGAAPATAPEIHFYVAGVGAFYGLVFLLAGALGGPGSAREYFGGAALAALAIFAYIASRDLPGMSGFKFGPGTAPRGFATVLGALGLVLAANGAFTKGPGIDRFHIRGPVFVTLSVLIFAATVRSFGLAASSFLSICAAAAATPDARVVETLIWAVVLTAFCCVLFLSPYLLGLPIPLWPVSSDPMVLIKGISFQ